MALNVDIDLEPFSRINPCGYKELRMTDLKRLGAGGELAEVWRALLPHLLHHLGFDAANIQRGEDELPVVADPSAD